MNLNLAGKNVLVTGHPEGLGYKSQGSSPPKGAILL